MLKKNLFGYITFFMFSLILLLGLSSKSYAWTFDQFMEFVQQVASNPNAPAKFRNNCNIMLNNRAILESTIDTTCDTYFIWNAATTGWIGIYTYKGTIPNIRVDDNRLIWDYTYMKSYRLDRSGTMPGTQGSNTQTNNTTYGSTIGLIEMPSNIEDLIPQEFWLQNRYIQGFEFTTHNDGVVTYNGYQNVNAIKINFFNARTLLGYMNKLNADCDYYRYVVLDPNGNRIAWLNYHIGNSYYSSENMEINIETSNIYVDTRLLYVNNIYSLAIYGSQEPLFDDISAALDSQVFTYVPLRQNAVISGGAVTNEGSGDNYTPQNQTNDILNNINDVTEANNTVNNFFSGDSDSFASSIGYSPVQNPFVAIIENTLETIIDIILGSGNETLTLGMHGNSIVLHSEDFVIPDGQIKTFITLVTNGFLIWAIIKYGFQLYQWINTGRLQNLVNEANGHWYKALF